MEKRVILAFILSIAVVWGFQTLYRPTEPVAPVPPAESASSAAPSSPSVSPAPVPAPAAVPQTAPTTPVAAGAAEDVPVDTPLYTATFTNTGAVLKSFTLRAYSDAEGRPIELINPASGPTIGWPLAFATGDAALDELLAKSNFAV